MEADAAPGGPANAQSQSSEQSLPEPLVGPHDVRMESAHDTRAVLNQDVTKAFVVNETHNRCRIIYADEIPVEEVCLEIQDTAEDFVMTFKTEPMDEMLSPIPSHDYEHLKSPMNTFSDCGYESHGSPVSLPEFSFNDQQDDINHLFYDLFPALVA